MLHKTRAIILRQTNYSESSIVVQAFTEKLGLLSFLVNGARKPKAKIRASLMQPLHLLELVVYYRENQGLQRIAEARPTPHLQTIPYDILKSAVAVFLNEVLYKTLKQQGEDPVLFDFVFNTVSWLDSVEKMPANFHLFFLLKLTRFLGFYPAIPKKDAIAPYFDLRNGVFSETHPGHAFILAEQETPLFIQLLSANLDRLHLLHITLVDRRILIRKILLYYQLHIESFGEIRSLEILEEVLA